MGDVENVGTPTVRQEQLIEGQAGEKGGSMQEEPKPESNKQMACFPLDEISYTQGHILHNAVPGEKIVNIAVSGTFLHLSLNCYVAMLNTTLNWT